MTAGFRIEQIFDQQKNLKKKDKKDKKQVPEHWSGTSIMYYIKKYLYIHLLKQDYHNYAVSMQTFSLKMICLWALLTGKVGCCSDAISLTYKFNFVLVLSFLGSRQLACTVVGEVTQLTLCLSRISIVQFWFKNNLNLLPALTPKSCKSKHKEQFL